MPNKRIDQLPPSSDQVKGTDLFPIFSDNKTERISIDSLISFIGSGTTDTYISGGTYSNGTLTLGRNDGVDLTVSGLYTGGTVGLPTYIEVASITKGGSYTVQHNLNLTNYKNFILTIVDDNTGIVMASSGGVPGNGSSPYNYTAEATSANTIEIYLPIGEPLGSQISSVITVIGIS